MVLLFVIKATVLLLAALAAAHMIRRSPARARHRLWSGAFVGLLLLPLLPSLLPSVAVPVPQLGVASPQPGVVVQTPSAAVRQLSSAGSESRVPSGHDGTTPLAGAPRDSEPAPWATLGLRDTLLALWAIGTGIGLATLALSLARVRLLIRDAEPLTDETWLTAAASVADRLGIRRLVRLVISDAIVTPMAGGIVRPTVFLPRAARDWDSDRRDVVLTHELAHLAAHDPARHVAARVALSCYWFHPLAWIAASEGVAAREQACDEAVLALGTRPSVYARVLLDLADTLRTAPPAAALPIVHRTSLEKRLMTILNEHGRPSRRTMTFAPLVGIAAVTAGLAAAHPTAPQRPETLANGQWRMANGTASSAALPHASPASTIATTPPEPSASPAAPASTQRRYSMANDCGWEWSRDGYSGSTSYNLESGMTFSQFRHDGHDRTIANQSGDVKACMLAEGVGGDRNTPPSQWLPRARLVKLATSRGGIMQQMEIARDGGERITWTVGGTQRPVDGAARAWRDRLLAYLDTTWELGHLRGRVSSLQGDISSIYGDRSSLQGDISSLHGDVSSMRGDISSVRGDESSMRGEISSIQGELSSLEGQISSELGAISSIQGMGLQASRDENNRLLDRIEAHRRNITQLQRQIREFDAPQRIAAVEKRMADFNADRRVAEIEARIKAFNVDARVAEIQRRIAALDVDGRVKKIEEEIRALDADRRGREIEGRIEQERRRLDAAIAAVR